MTHSACLAKSSCESPIKAPPDYSNNNDIAKSCRCVQGPAPLLLQQASQTFANFRSAFLTGPCPLGRTAFTLAMSSASSELVGRGKKAGGKRLRHRWLCMSSEGELREVTMGKATITHRLGVQVPTAMLLQRWHPQRLTASTQSSRQTVCSAVQLLVYQASCDSNRHSPLLGCAPPSAKVAGTGGAAQARDLRLLDAETGAAPPAVLVRDKAIVINLEFFKTIITTG